VAGSRITRCDVLSEIREIVFPRRSMTIVGVPLRDLNPDCRDHTQRNTDFQAKHPLSGTAGSVASVTLRSRGLDAAGAVQPSVRDIHDVIPPGHTLLCTDLSRNC